MRPPPAVERWVPCGGESEPVRAGKGKLVRQQLLVAARRLRVPCHAPRPQHGPQGCKGFNA